MSLRPQILFAYYHFRIIAIGVFVTPSASSSFPWFCCPCVLFMTSFILAAEYSASKAYVDFFSRSLAREYGPKGIWISCQSPYFVATKMSKIRYANLFAPSPDGWARAAVNAIGASGGDADSTVPYWAHALQDAVMQHAPRFAVTSYLMDLHHSMRSKFLKKVAEKDGKAQ